MIRINETFRQTRLETSTWLWPFVNLIVTPRASSGRELSSIPCKSIHSFIPFQFYIYIYPLYYDIIDSKCTYFCLQISSVAYVNIRTLIYGFFKSDCDLLPPARRVGLHSMYSCEIVPGASVIEMLCSSPNRFLLSCTYG